MPQRKKAQKAVKCELHELACDANPVKCDKCTQKCMNCRREVLASMTRVAGRKLRRLKALPECSAEKCAEFLLSITDPDLRFHLSSMAWWRFSADNDPSHPEQLRRIMVGCHKHLPALGTEYMHSAIKAMSKLSQEQMSVWFGCDSVYAVASVFVGDRLELVGSHCKRCHLYKLGCTEYGTLAAEKCTLWEDRFVQSVAASVKRRGGWNDPCNGISDKEGA